MPLLIAAVGFALVLLLCPAGAGAQEQGDSEGQTIDVVAEAGRLLTYGRPSEARSLLEQAIEQVGSSEDRLVRLQLLVMLGVAWSELDRVDRVMLTFAEAIGLADAVAADPATGLPTLGSAIRVQLAETLRARGHHADAEAAGWDALDVAMRLDSLPSTGPPIRLIVLSAIDAGASRAELASLVTELDLALGDLDAYRLSTPPPPEPIAVALEQMARELAANGDMELAAETFAALTELDAARGADWRLEPDLSQLSWTALQGGDLRRARWLLQQAEARAGDGPRSVEVLANRCALWTEEGRFAEAISLCTEAVELARSQRSTYQAAALLGRTALLHSALGDSRVAVALHGDAASLFSEGGFEGDAVLERGRAARALAAGGKLDAADDELAEALDGLDPESLPRSLAEIAVELKALRAQDLSTPRATQELLLAEAEKWLFEQERADELISLARQHVYSAVVDDGAGNDEGTLAALDALTALAEGVGLGGESTDALELRALMVGGPGDVEAQLERRFDGLVEATARIEWRVERTRPVPDAQATTAGEPPRPVFDPERLHEEALLHLSVGGRAEQALSLAERLRSIRLLEALRSVDVGTSSASEEELLQIRDRIDGLRLAAREVSFRGGERPPSEVRAELDVELATLREQETEALSSMTTDRRLLRSVLEAQPGGVDGAVVLSVVKAGSQFVVFLVDADGVRAHATGRDSPLAEAIEGFARSAGRKPGRKYRATMDAATLGLISQELVHPYEAELRAAERILWVPDGALRDVPLAALAYTGGGLVGESTEIVTAPSLVLAQEIARSPWSPPTGRQVVSTTTTETGLTLHAEGSVMFDLGCDAGGRRPAASALRMTPGGTAGRFVGPTPPDGLLQPDEVLASGWTPALVVLPRCSFEDHDGLDLWATVFLLGGAGAVLQPRWETTEEATALLLERFEVELSEGTPPATALHRAQAAVRRKWKDPRAWAGWTLASPLSP